ncbi:sensor histidine kinase [Streptomyces luteolifulvus]|uniref:Sensor histidine kinase n=1 Tax=Streptomyces luteolifulvus TaxID=2615112 RepID=A0A6H9V2Y8_9ACTN|nr:histidine kinase [Streptomyces luteolifulvus]KAB1149168.1 sensor histidine kinase [Streptomyces luteolifulvus]
MRGPVTWWRGKSTPAKVETYTRWSFHFFVAIEIATVGLPALGQVEPGLAGRLVLMVCVHGGVCAVTAARALDWTRGRREQPVRMLWTLGGVTAAVAVAAVWIGEHGPGGDEVDTATGGLFATVLVVGAGVMTLGVRRRRRASTVVAGFAAGSGLVAFALGVPAPAALLTVVTVLIGAGLLAFTSAFSVWLLNTVYELDEARETRARLAVAEERLRFGRDLHDVMGRNLAVIALKSELAVQLARRGRPEAVEQMIEVQRIAQESQREVRDVVRGYREADLGAELAGAQGVLTAAGIRCEVSGETAGLPAEVQSALGWVVREATTNVLRHGDAGRCTVALSVTEERVVLTVENDGARATGGGGGSGLAGLRERLTAVDGELEAGSAGDDRFRVTATVPLPTVRTVSEVTS